MAERDALQVELEGRHRVWDATVAALVLILAVVVVRPPLAPSHDMAMLLEIAHRNVEGAVPYVDWVEVNPPWIHTLLTVPVRLALLLGAPIATTYQLTVVGLVAAGLAAVRWVLARAGAEPIERGVLLVGLVAHALVVADGHDFGQKDHLFFLCTAPWAFALVYLDGRVDDRGGRALLVALGWLAAIGAQIKPHFIAVGVVFAAALAWRREWRLAWSPAAVGYVAGGLLGYPVLLLVLPAESWEAIRTFYLPELLPQYAGLSSDWLEILGISAIPAVLYAVSAGLAWTGRSDKRVVGPFLGLLLLALGAYVLQGKGFQYHRIPPLGFAAILAGLGVIGWHTTERPTAAGAWMTTLLAGAYLLGRGLIAGPPVDPVWDAVDTHAEPGDRILVIDSAVWPTWPGLMTHGYRPSSRWFTVGYPIGLSYDDASYRTLDRAEGLEELVFDEIAEDLARDEPPVVLVATGRCKFCPEGFDLLELVEHNGFLDELADYRRVEDAGGFAMYVRGE